jgi:hypothetical protein
VNSRIARGFSGSVRQLLLVEDPQSKRNDPEQQHCEDRENERELDERLTSRTIGG